MDVCANGVNTSVDPICGAFSKQDGGNASGDPIYGMNRSVDPVDGAVSSQNGANARVDPICGALSNQDGDDEHEDEVACDMSSEEYVRRTDAVRWTESVGNEACSQDADVGPTVPRAVPWPRVWLTLLVNIRALPKPCFWEIFAGMAVLSQEMCEMQWGIAPPIGHFRMESETRTPDTNTRTKVENTRGSTQLTCGCANTRANTAE